MKAKKILKIHQSLSVNHGDAQKMGILILFILLIIIAVIWHSDNVSNPLLLGFAAIIGGYMALNIGANDVANNVGPAVGSKSLTMAGAIIIAAICEISGAILAGGEVVKTVRTGIISLQSIGDPQVFITLMLASLISGALWLHFATSIGAPVSTTHSIVGGILGAGIAAGGFAVINWKELLNIAASWIISPVLGGIIAAGFLLFIKNTITYKQNKKVAAKKIIPFLLALMTWAFSFYLITKGLKRVLMLNPIITLAISIFLALLVFLITRPIIQNTLEKLENKKEEINKLFTIPLIFAAAILSFAHGANDVANAIGPLAAIYDAINLTQNDHEKTPFWIMLLGGLGISIGLALFGPKLIKTVGSEITELNQMHAFCVAMSSALTVILASELGMPVSSTHIAIGAIFGVGFLREYLKKRYKKMELKILESYKDKDIEEIKVFLEKFRCSSIKRKASILQNIDRKKAAAQHSTKMPELKKKEVKQLKKIYQKELVKRSAVSKIISAWLITVPISAIIGTISYFALSALNF